MSKSEGYEHIERIREAIFARSLESLDVETLHWWMWLDECFENDDWPAGRDLAAMKYRLQVLRLKQIPMGNLLFLVDAEAKRRSIDMLTVETGL